MPNRILRIRIPQKPVNLLDLAERIYQKHLEDKEQSPLKMLQSNSWENNGAKVADCLAHHRRAEELRLEMEKEYSERNLLLKDVIKTVKASRDMLKGVYHDIPKQLGEWGFEVDDTPRKPKKKE